MPFINQQNHCFIIVWDDFPYSTKLCVDLVIGGTKYLLSLRSLYYGELSTESKIITERLVTFLTDQEIFSFCFLDLDFSVLAVAK